MKKLLFLFLFPTLLSAQEITKDTSYLTNSGGNFFNVSRVEYENGAYSETSTLIGDTLAVLSLYVNKISNEANQYASAAVIAMRAQSATASLSKLDTIMTAKLLRSPITSIMDSYEREFLVGSWQIISSGIPTSVTFPRLSTNRRIRILPSGGTARTMLIYGNMLRLTNYPVSGNNTLFKVREGRWENLTRTIILRRI
jgi:hypothetical protein